MKVFTKWVRCLALGITAVSATGCIQFYHDRADMETEVRALDGALGGVVSVDSIGQSALGQDILAVKFSKPSDIETPRIGLLIECGHHAREWAAAEVCFQFIKNVIDDFNVVPTSGNSFESILDRINLFVIPMVNPDGRDIDDMDGGNPYKYNQTNQSIGWRRNGQSILCPSTGINEIGIDVNRNYSRGFNTGATDCGDRQYPGPFPFSAIEAQVMRDFVNNHLIAMSLSVHGNGQTFGRTLDSSTNPSISALAFVDVFNNSAANTDLEIEIGTRGTGSGQVTDWFVRTSSTTGTHDTGSIRGINAYLLELPVKTDKYEDPNSIYRYESPFYAGADQHGFRPTWWEFIPDIKPAIRESFRFTMMQASSPWLDIDPATGTPLPCIVGCQDDMALVGSKLLPVNASLDSAGLLSEIGVVRPEGGISAGQYRPVYGVQNSSNSVASLTSDISILVEEIDPSGLATSLFSDVTTISLAQGEVEIVQGPLFDYPTGDYRLTIDITTPDDLSSNDTHIFRFVVD